MFFSWKHAPSHFISRIKELKTPLNEKWLKAVNERKHNCSRMVKHCKETGSSYICLIQEINIVDINVCNNTVGLWTRREAQLILLEPTYLLMNSDLCKIDIDGAALGWVEMSDNRDYALVIHNTVKAIPLQAWIRPEVSRKFRFPDF